MFNSTTHKNSSTKSDSSSGLTNLPEFDFDEWKELHANDPEAFEEKRIEWLTHCIVDSPQQYHKRLNGIMFRVNAIRQIEKNPMQTCIKVSSMMMDSLNDMRSFLSELNHVLLTPDTQSNTEATSADILDFSRPSNA